MCIYRYIYRSLGVGCPNGKCSAEKCVCVCVCVRARGLCGERRRLLTGQTRGSQCTSSSSAAPARISAGRCLGFVSLLSRFCLGFVSFCLGFVSVVSVLSRFYLGFVSPHLPQTPYHPTGGVIGIYMLLKLFL